MESQEALNKFLVQRFGEAVNSGRLDLLDDLVSPGFVRNCQATPWLNIRSLDAFKQFQLDDRAAVPDGQTTARILVAEGEFVAIYGTYAGTQTGRWGPIPPSGKRFEIDISGVFRIADGRIVELWITWDNMAVLQQIGALPSQAESH